jgi:NodT family efflux transporter outer membrane factor (OMF) lipoprotein
MPPPGLPSELLERRPDIAGTERRVASANEQIGIARAAFFPSITLGLVGGLESGQFPSWLTGPSALWSIGASAAETVFDFGRRRAISDQTIATYDELIADYQQTVLTAFQEVEDSLSDLHVLEDESKTQDAAVAAANRALEQSTNRYKGGLDTYLVVITAQNAALGNERTAVSLLTRRLTSTVLLVKALGGGWNVSQMPAVNPTVSVMPTVGRAGRQTKTTLEIFKSRLMGRFVCPYGFIQSLLCAGYAVHPQTA